MTRHNIYVYDDEGTSKMSQRALLKSLNETVDKEKYKIITISASQINDDILEHAYCLIFGGGYDLGFIKALGVNRMLKIKNFVENGGRYLGICAGAYFASNKVIFDKGGTYEVIGDRWLKFFKGNSIGPEFKGYVPNTEDGSKAVNVIRSDQESFRCYYNGGGRFEENELREYMDAYEILAYYDKGVGITEDGRDIAVVKCYCKRGIAVLLGIHCEFEYNEMGIRQDISDKLKASNVERKQFFINILNQLEISTNPQSITR